MPASQTTNTSPAGFSAMYQGAKELSQHTQEAFMILKVAARIVKAFTDVVAYPWLVLLRYDFGERFLNGWLVLLSSFSLALIAVAAGSTLGQVLSVALFGLWAIHKRRIRQRNKRGMRWHSQGNGVSWLQRFLPKLSSSRTDRLYEPVILAMLGLIWFGTSYALQTVDYFGFYIAFAGVCLHLHHAANQKRLRHLLLDQIDSQILSEHFADALKGDINAHQTDGFVVQGADRWTDQERQMITEAVLAS